MSDQLALDLYQQDVSSFYTDDICPEAETVYRFLLSIGFKEAKAQQYLAGIFAKIAGDVTPFKKANPSADAIRSQVLAFVWEDLSTSGFKQSQSPAPLEKLLGPLSVAERAVLVLADGLGCSLAAVEEVVNAPREQILAALVAGRKAIVPESCHPQTDNSNVIIARLSEYLDGDMSEAHSQKYEPLLQADAPELAARFAEAKGQLQVALQKFYLSEDTRNLVLGSGISDKKRRQFEAQQIDEAGSLETKGRWLRGLILVGLLAIFAIGTYAALRPAPKSSFDPLTALSYEAVMMEEEGTGRLEFLTSSIDDVNEFLGDANSIGFAVPAVHAMPAPWILDGATIIDYETDKIATIQYQHPDIGKMFIFYYKGSLQDLPTSSGAHVRDVYYQSYGNDQMNVIAYSPAEDIVGMVVGRESAAKLAELTLPASPP